MLDIQKIIDKITRIKNFKIKSFEIIFDELDEIISELQAMKDETDSDNDYEFNTNDIKALRHYVNYLKK